MGDCNLSSAYPSIKHEDKYCKYSYTSWCHICDRESPRRRTKSETNESCRKKGKEMKTFTPKKYHNRSHEYENMDLDYESKELRYECCRTRSNLCELPTSYISNNCQIFNDMSNYSKVSSGTSDYTERPPKTYENTIKIVDFWNAEQNSHNSMTDKAVKNGYRNGEFHEKHKSSSKLTSGTQLLTPLSSSRKSPQKQENTTSASIYLNSKHIANALSPTSERKTSHYPDKNHIYRCTAKPKLPKQNLACHVVDINATTRPDTCTFFDQRDYDIANIKERYHREVEALRAKLKEIQKKRLLAAQLLVTDGEIIEVKPDETQQTVQIVSPTKFPQWSTAKDGGRESTTSHDCNSNSSSTGTIRKKSVRRVKVDKLKTEKSRMVVKSRSKLNIIKLRQAQAKSKIVQQELSQSEISESEDEHDDKATDTKLAKIQDVDCTSELAKVSSHKSSEISDNSGADGDAAWPLRDSIFPNVPPYIKFNCHDAAEPFSLPNGRRCLKWKLSPITPVLVRKTLTNTGFTLIRKSNEWLGCWGKHMKSPQFTTLKDTQKLNHFPGTFQVGRKDRLWKNLQRLMCKFGYKEFGFIPQSFVLPHDLKLLKQSWENKNGTGSEIFIIKPPASARGAGIKVINKWTQLPKKQPLVVQRYISNPYLINGSKFDLRLYVLVTSFNPLRIYLYPEGLARFASAKYSGSAKDLKDRYMHLTNYSINKLSSQYTANEDAFSCQGHKWTLSKLWEYMEKEGVDTKSLWKSMEDLVIKTMISGEVSITQLSNENLTSRYNCYELFGIDILLDERLKCWLLEVNISPSLHSASPLDAHVKGPMVKSLFDMAQFHLPPKLQRLQNAPKCYEPKIYTMALTKRERNKHNYFSQLDDRDDYLTDILKTLTGDDVRHLTQAEDELPVMGAFKRIFPTSTTYPYLKFMEVRYYNRLFDAWENKYAQDRLEGIEVLRKLCSEKIHLKIGSQSNIVKGLPNTIPALECLHPERQTVQPNNELDNHIRSLMS